MDAMKLALDIVEGFATEKDLDPRINEVWYYDGPGLQFWMNPGYSWVDGREAYSSFVAFDNEMFKEMMDMVMSDEEARSMGVKIPC